MEENLSEYFQFNKKEVLELIIYTLKDYSLEELIYILKSLLKENKQQEAPQEVEINTNYVGSSFDEFLNEEGILLECTKIAEEKVDEYLTPKISNEYKKYNKLYDFNSVKIELEERIKTRKYYNFDRQSIEDYFNISTSLACKVIKTLIKEGKIEKKGTGKYCSYSAIRST